MYITKPVPVTCCVTEATYTIIKGYYKLTGNDKMPVVWATQNVWAEFKSKFRTIIKKEIKAPYL